jgi:hypothetical protein
MAGPPDVEMSRVELRRLRERAIKFLVTLSLSPS